MDFTLENYIKGPISRNAKGHTSYNNYVKVESKKFSIKTQENEARKKAEEKA